MSRLRTARCQQHRTLRAADGRGGAVEAQRYPGDTALGPKGLEPNKRSGVSPVQPPGFAVRSKPRDVSPKPARIRSNSGQIWSIPPRIWPQSVEVSKSSADIKPIWCACRAEGGAKSVEARASAMDPKVADSWRQLWPTSADVSPTHRWKARAKVGARIGPTLWGRTRSRHRSSCWSASVQTSSTPRANSALLRPRALDRSGRTSADFGAHSATEPERTERRPAHRENACFNMRGKDQINKSKNSRPATPADKHRSEKRVAGDAHTTRSKYRSPAISMSQRISRCAQPGDTQSKSKKGRRLLLMYVFNVSPHKAAPATCSRAYFSAVASPATNASSCFSVGVAGDPFFHRFVCAGVAGSAAPSFVFCPL